MSTSSVSSSETSSSTVCSSNALKRKHSSEIEQEINRRSNQNIGSSADKTPHVDFSRIPIGWSLERYLMIIFNSFSLTDIQIVLDIHPRPKGIPKEWHVGYCAHQGCNMMVEDDLTGSGWCEDHFGPQVVPLSLYRVRQILIDGLFGRTDNRLKLEKILEESNGVFLVRREIDEILAVTLEIPEKEYEERSSKRQRMCLENTPDNEVDKDPSIKSSKSLGKVNRGEQHISGSGDAARRPLVESKDQLQVSRAQVGHVDNGCRSARNIAVAQPTRTRSLTSHQQSTPSDSSDLICKKNPQAVYNHNMIARVSGKKRKATQDSEVDITKRSRLDRKSSAVSLQPSSLETYFKNARAQASPREIPSLETYFNSARAQASFRGTQISTRQAFGNKKRMQEPYKNRNKPRR